MCPAAPVSEAFMQCRQGNIQAPVQCGGDCTAVSEPHSHSARYLYLKPMVQPVNLLNQSASKVGRLVAKPSITMCKRRAGNKVLIDTCILPLLVIAHELSHPPRELFRQGAHQCRSPNCHQKIDIPPKLASSKHSHKKQVPLGPWAPRLEP